MPGMLAELAELNVGDPGEYGDIGDFGYGDIGVFGYGDIGDFGDIGALGNFKDPLPQDPKSCHMSCFRCFGRGPRCSTAETYFVWPVSVEIRCLQGTGGWALWHEGGTWMKRIKWIKHTNSHIGDTHAPL